MNSGTRVYAEALRDLRRAFDADVLPHRARLFGYCLHLTRDGLLAEDLHQETMLKAFAQVTERFEPIEHPRAWLFRVATRTWLDWQRKRTEVLVDDLPLLAGQLGDAQADGADDGTPTTTREVEQALEPLLQALPPRELAALLLRDLYGFTGAETAEILGASEAAVKMAVVRGRRRARALRADGDRAAPALDDRAVPPALLTAFVEAFTARDIAALAQIIHEHASARAMGCATEAGRREILRGTLRYALAHTHVSRCAPVRYRGHWLVAMWYRADDASATGAPTGPGDAVSDLVSLSFAEDRIAAITLRWFSPDLIAHVCGELGLPFRSHGYGPPDGVRWWNAPDDG